MTKELTVGNEESMMERVLIGGDLSALSDSQRVMYYQKTCESLKLNPLTKPFDYIKLNGKLTLYARKDATEQLRKINGVSIIDLAKEWKDSLGLYIVTAKASDKTGRSDAATGVVSVKGKSGEDLANALMKCESKAKRRVTLSICGLGFLDESEASSIKDAEMTVVTEEGEIVEPKKKAKATPASEDIVDGEVVVHPEDMDGGGVHETAEQPAELQKMVKIWIGDKYVEKPAHDLITQKQVKWFQETFGDKPKEEAKPTNGKMNAFHLFGKIGGESKGTMGRFGRTNFISPKDPKDAMTFGQFASLVGYSYWCAKDEEHGFLDPFYFEDKITESIAKKLGATVTVVKEAPSAEDLTKRATELGVGAGCNEEKDSPINFAFGNNSLADAQEFQRVMIDQVLDQVAAGAVEASDDNAIIGLLTAA